MIQLTEQQIKEARDAASLNAGHNAYFGEGFKAGVGFALKHLDEYKFYLFRGWNKQLRQSYNKLIIAKNREDAILDFETNYPNLKWTTRTELNS